MISEKSMPDKHRNIVLTALETLGIAATAALAGFLIGRLVTR
jgi:hypothetical protein